MEQHTIPPYYNQNSEIIILGSFPSLKSRAAGFYYAHPQNRFWRVLKKVYNTEFRDDIESKKAFLKKYKIALFDVCAACVITKSSDASIKQIIPNDIKQIISKTNIKKIYINGKTAAKIYDKYLKKDINIEVIYLPSTSSANAKFSLDDLVNEYKVLNLK